MKMKNAQTHSRRRMASMNIHKLNSDTSGSQGLVSQYSKLSRLETIEASMDQKLNGTMKAGNQIGGPSSGMMEWEFGHSVPGARTLRRPTLRGGRISSVHPSMVEAAFPSPSPRP